LSLLRSASSLWRAATWRRRERGGEEGGKEGRRQRVVPTSFSISFRYLGSKLYLVPTWWREKWRVEDWREDRMRGSEGHGEGGREG